MGSKLTKVLVLPYWYPKFPVLDLQGLKHVQNKKTGKQDLQNFPIIVKNLLYNEKIPYLVICAYMC